MSAVSTGALIHLTRAGALYLLKELYEEIYIPTEVYEEAVIKGKSIGAPDAYEIDGQIGKWIKIEDVAYPEEIVNRSGLHRGEIAAIYLARQKNLELIVDDHAARQFATGLGINIRGSIGIIILAVKKKIITPSKGKEYLEKLSRVMYLSNDVYLRALKLLE